MPEWIREKIAIVGSGSVGASIAYACLGRGVAGKIAFYDSDRSDVQTQVLALTDGVHFVLPAQVEGSDDIEICRGADVVVIAAGTKQKAGQSRMELAAANAVMCRELVPKLLAVAPESVLLVVTDPVDVITYVALKLSGLPAQRVMGSGTVLESDRFRMLIARRCRVAADDVHAYIAGEQGESQIPLWSSASIASILLKDWAVPGHGKLTVRDRTEIFQNAKDAARQIIANKGMASFGVGMAATQILESILRDENRVLTVSSLLNGYHGISDVCLSVPCIVNAKGVEQALPIPLNANEEAGLKNSAEQVRTTLVQLGL